MSLGLVFGGYWCLKYVFLILGAYWPVYSMVYWIMTMAVPYLAYRLTIIYRRSLDNQIGGFHAQISSMGIPSAVQMTFQDILNNVFYGIIFSIPVAWIAKKKSI